MTKKLSWKRIGDAQGTSCGRYWLVEEKLFNLLREMELDNGCTTTGGEVGQFRLWHADTCVIVGHYATKSDAKAAAEKHLAGFADEVRKLRHRVVDLEVAVENLIQSALEEAGVDTNDDFPFASKEEAETA